MLTRRHLFSLAALSLLACTNPKDRPLTRATLDEINRSKALTGEELQLLQGYVLRTGLAAALAGADTSALLDSTITVAQAIDRQRKWRIDDSTRNADEAQKAKEALARYEAEVARLRGLVTVTVVKKGFAEYDYESYNTFQFVVRNTSDRTVRGIKGYLRVEDLFGDAIARLEVKEDSPLKPGAERISRGSYEYNRFMDRDSKLRYTDLDKMKIAWEPEVIIFDDGEELRVPSSPSP